MRIETQRSSTIGQILRLAERVGHKALKYARDKVSIPQNLSLTDFLLTSQKIKISLIDPKGPDYAKEIKGSIVTALKRSSHEKAANLSKVIDEAIEIARDHDRSIPYETLLYRARKIAEIGGNVIAVAAVLLQDIPIEKIGTLLEQRKNGEIYKLGSSICKILTRVKYLQEFEFSIDKLQGNKHYIENKHKELIRRSKYYEAFLLFLFDRLQKARKASSAEDPILDQGVYFYAPLAERMHAVYLADDLRDQYLRMKDPATYHRIENEVVAKRIGMSYDEAKIFLRGFVSSLKEHLKGFPKEITRLVRFSLRVKSPYSVWDKTEVRKKYGVEQVNDILGVKIVCRSEDNVRAVARILQEKFSIPGENIDDSLGSQRDTGFRALTIILFDAKGCPIEIQIMTEEMDYNNTFYKAGTWKYNIEKKLKALDIKQDFDITIHGLLNGDPEKNFYRLYHHWAA